MDLDLDYARSETNAAFDRWLYWQLRLRDLLNCASEYEYEAFIESASAIKERVRNANLDMLSRLYRFECKWQQAEKEKQS